MSKIEVVCTRVSDENFVRACLRNSCIADLANDVGLSEATCSKRRKVLKDAGVVLPEYERKKKEIDVDALNAIVKSE